MLKSFFISNKYLFNVNIVTVARLNEYTYSLKYKLLMVLNAYYVNVMT